MTAPELLAELTARGVRLEAHGDRLRYDAPAGALTPELRTAVKTCKPELLALVAGGYAAPAKQGNNSGEAAPAQLETHADWERRRFLAVCKPRPDGRGWYDPAHAAALEALANATAPRPAQTMTGRQPDLYEVDGQRMTFVERAEYWRQQRKAGTAEPDSEGTAP